MIVIQRQREAFFLCVFVSVGRVYAPLRLCVVLFLAGLLTGCETQATPLPAVLPPTATPVPVPTLPPPLRYAFTANTAGYVADINRIRETGLVEQLTDNNTDESVLAGYDIVATFGIVEGWQQSPNFPHIALVMNAGAPPLDNPLVVDTITHSLNSRTMVAALAIPGAEANPLQSADTRVLRTDLANAGFPDGFDLVLAHRILPGTELIAQQLNQVNLRLALIPVQHNEAAEAVYQEKRAHLLLIAWGTPDERAAWVERAGENNVIDLYTLPVSYRVQGDIRIEFVADGFPMGRR